MMSSAPVTSNWRPGWSSATRPRHQAKAHRPRRQALTQSRILRQKGKDSSRTSRTISAGPSVIDPSLSRQRPDGRTTPRVLASGSKIGATQDPVAQQELIFHRLIAGVLVGERTQDRVPPLLLRVRTTVIGPATRTG